MTPPDTAAEYVVGETRLVAVMVCSLCLGGIPGECHTPGCWFWMKDAPTKDEARVLSMLPLKVGMRDD